MREIRKWLEMLDEAAKQLDKYTGTGARLALMLLDNVAEIAMHEKLRILFARDSRLSSRLKPGKFPPPIRKKAMQDFKEKVRLLVAQSDTVTEDQGRTMRVGHVLRNEAYHRGIVREPIIQEVARTYLEAICAAIPRLWTGTLLMSPSEDLKGFVKQFGVDASMIDESILRLVCARFAEGRCCDVNDLAGALSADLVRRLGQVIDEIEYLGDGGHERVPAEEVLKNLQFSPQFHDTHTFANTDEGFRQFVETRAREYAQYSPPITIKSFAGWRKQTEAIAPMKAPGQALDQYVNIDKAFSDIEEAVGQAVYEFDEWVNMQVHDRGL